MLSLRPEVDHRPSRTELLPRICTITSAVKIARDWRSTTAAFPQSSTTVFVGVFDAQIAAQLERFEAVEPSDWFLNRAMWYVWIAMAYEHQRREGAKRSRDFAYYTRCAWNSLVQWRAWSKDVKSAEERARAQM